MKVLGISGSPRTEGTTQLIQEVLGATGVETEFVSLKGKRIGACIACLGCVKDNVCVVNDDMKALRDKIVSADAYVFGAANYYMNMNALAHCFMERWYQFRHQEGQAVTGKLAVAVGIGGGSPGPVCEMIEMIMGYNLIETVAKVGAQGTASCFTCGYGETCKVGAVHMLLGPGTKITEENTPRVSKQPEALEAARLAGQTLGDRLRAGNDRAATAQKVMGWLGAKFKEAT
jgi:multimeric flavodoxin WrbA